MMFVAWNRAAESAAHAVDTTSGWPHVALQRFHRCPTPGEETSSYRGCIVVLVPDVEALVDVKVHFLRSLHSDQLPAYWTGLHFHR